MSATREAAADAPRLYIIHDNPEWITPFAASLDAAGVPYTQWLLGSDEATSAGLVGTATNAASAPNFDLAAQPPAGVFWSRLSASAHTRGRPLAKEHGRALLAWLAEHGRRVVNGAPVLEFEVSKVRQYLALSRAGIPVPHTVAVPTGAPTDASSPTDASALGRDRLLTAAADFPTPFITKHNQGGKGLGVRRFDSQAEFAAYASGPDFEEPIDGIALLQEYVEPAQPFITRAEFIGGRFHYAARVDTSAGSFQLCPADDCAVPASGDHAPFELRPEVTADHPLIVRVEAFLAAAGIELAGVEFIETADGRQVVYDVNTNTNYNAAVESAAQASAGGTSGVTGRATDRVAAFLSHELAVSS